MLITFIRDLCSGYITCYLNLHNLTGYVYLTFPLPLQNVLIPRGDNVSSSFGHSAPVVVSVQLACRRTVYSASVISIKLVSNS
jgi:hypothetical protein